MARRTAAESLELLLTGNESQRAKAVTDLSNALRSGRAVPFPDPEALEPGPRFALRPLWTAQRAMHGDWGALDRAWPALTDREIPRVLISYGNGEEYNSVLLTHAQRVDHDDVEQVFGALYAFSRWWRRGMSPLSAMLAPLMEGLGDSRRSETGAVTLSEFCRTHILEGTRGAGVEAVRSFLVDADPVAVETARRFLERWEGHVATTHENEA